MKNATGTTSGSGNPGLPQAWGGQCGHASSYFANGRLLQRHQKIPQDQLTIKARHFTAAPQATKPLKPDVSPAQGP